MMVPVNTGEEVQYKWVSKLGYSQGESPEMALPIHVVSSFQRVACYRQKLDSKTRAFCSASGSSTFDLLEP